jgi:hypothetical protein
VSEAVPLPLAHASVDVVFASVLFDAAGEVVLLGVVGDAVFVLLVVTGVGVAVAQAANARMQIETTALKSNFLFIMFLHL